MAASEQETEMQQVDAALREWRQGDCVLGEHWFVYRFDPQQPLTESSKAVDDDTDLAESEVMGLAVVTQTCDIIRSCTSRSFVEVVPLVMVDETWLSEIKRGRRPQYAFIPGTADKRLVADLDRVMTVEKAVVAKWCRINGCSNDKEIRDLGQSLARKRVRFAFPDDFTNLAQSLQKRLQEKHPKLSDEGKALRALREIRVRAAPSWDAPEIEIMFWFILNENNLTFNGAGWHEMLEKWLDLVPESGRFKSIEGQASTLEDLTAKDYVESNPLDLEHLSTS